MDDYASSNNGWVEMYLNALLGEGLSKEYEQGVQHDHGRDTKALYFLNKAIEVDESAIVTSWRRAQVRPRLGATAVQPAAPLRARRVHAPQHAPSVRGELSTQDSFVVCACAWRRGGSGQRHPLPRVGQMLVLCPGHPLRNRPSHARPTYAELTGKLPYVRCTRARTAWRHAVSVRPADLLEPRSHRRPALPTLHDTALHGRATR